MCLKHTFILTVVSQNRMHCRISPLVGVMRRTVIGRRSLVFLSVRKRTLDGAFSYSLHIDTPFIKTPTIEFRLTRVNKSMHQK